MPDQQLTLIRGLPGSGKSTLANIIAQVTGAVILEADDFFETDEGYFFDPDMLHEAHKDCQQRCSIALEYEQSVIIANTFSRIWEMQPYISMAKERNIPLQVITCHGKFANTHNVPENTMRLMKARWENYNA